MKPDKQSKDDRSLDRVLDQWVVDAPLPPRFQEQVWKRIERAEARPQATFWSSLARWLDTTLPRPKVAYSYAAFLLVLGLAAGAWAAQMQNTKMETSLGSRYLHSIDPFGTALPDR